MTSKAVMAHCRAVRPNCRRPAGDLRSTFAAEAAVTIDDVVKQSANPTLGALQEARVLTASGKGSCMRPGLADVYRKDLAKKLGIEPPKTWDDFVKIAEKLTIDENKDGKPEIYGLTMPGDNLFINILVGEMMAANGGKLFDDKNRPLFQSRQMLETLDYWKRLTKFMPPGWEGHGYLDTFSNLYGQKAAMMYAGFGRGASLIEQYAPENMRNTETYDVWRKPHGPSGNAPASQVDEETWMLFKGSANPELAKEFLAFFYKDENYVEYIKSVPIHFFPITKSLRNSPAYRDIPMVKRWASWLQVQQEDLDKDQARPTLIIDWEDLTNKPYLLQILGSGVLRDMVLDVAVEGKPAAEAPSAASSGRADRASGRCREVVISIEPRRRQCRAASCFTDERCGSARRAGILICKRAAFLVFSWCCRRYCCL